jgi:hypothetical protein
MRCQKSKLTPASRGRHTSASLSASTGPLNNMDASPPARKAHAHEMHEKAGSISKTCELPWPVRRRYEEENCSQREERWR